MIVLFFLIGCKYNQNMIEKNAKKFFHLLIFDVNLHSQILGK